MDHEDGSSGGEGVDELSLPKATVTKLIHEMLPDDIVCSKETRDLLIDCCVEFIHLMASGANSACESDRKKTISPEHIISTLQTLGYSSYIPQVQDAYENHKMFQKERDKKTTKLDMAKLSEEELIKEQEALFEKARLKYLAQNQS